MYLSFLALIVPLTIALFVVVYICGRRYNIRSRERAQAAALNARTAAAFYTESSSRMVQRQLRPADHTDVGIQSESNDYELHVGNFRGDAWSPADDARVMHLLTYMNSLLEGGNMRTGAHHNSPAFARFSVAQPPSYTEVMAAEKSAEPPTYSSVAHIRPPSTVEVNDGTVTQPVAVTTDVNRVQYTTDMGIDNVSVSLV